MSKKRLKNTLGVPAGHRVRSVRCVLGTRTGWGGWQAVAMILVKGTGDGRSCTSPGGLETGGNAARLDAVSGLVIT